MDLIDDVPDMVKGIQVAVYMCAGTPTANWQGWAGKTAPVFYKVDFFDDTHREIQLNKGEKKNVAWLIGMDIDPWPYIIAAAARWWRPKIGSVK